METNIVSIALSTDDNYVEPAMVTITSILENRKKSTTYDFYILSSELKSENKQKLERLQTKCDKCRFVFIDMGGNFNNATVRAHGHITTAAYYRLLLPNLMKNLDKILYLDVDVIVLSDLSELFNTNIDNYYLAAVKGYNSTLMNNYARRNGLSSYSEVLNIPSMDQYVNSGVMLMNLKLMREENLEERFVKFVERNHGKNRLGLCHDQDVINAVCYGKIYFLSLKYNAMQHYADKYEKIQSLQDAYSKGEWEEAYKNPKIIHYSGPQKPWNNKKNINSDIWWLKYKKMAAY